MRSRLRSFLIRVASRLPRITMKKLFHLDRSKGGGYDTYDSCVVCSTDAESARYIHPASGKFWSPEHGAWVYKNSIGEVMQGYCEEWCVPQDVVVKEIGIANEDVELNSVVIASFNAG